MRVQNHKIEIKCNGGTEKKLSTQGWKGRGHSHYQANIEIITFNDVTKTEYIHVWKSVENVVFSLSEMLPAI